MLYAYQYNDSNKDMVNNICATRCPNELRETYVYDSRWFSLAAYIIEQLSGQTYGAFMESHILRPLGMTRSTFSSREAEPNAATPTITLDDAKTVQDLPFWYCKAQPGNSTEGVGGLFSTTSDMIKWIGYLMRSMKGENESEDPTVISTSTLKEVIRPRIIISGEAANPEMSPPLYALGVERYHL